MELLHRFSISGYIEEVYLLHYIQLSELRASAVSLLFWILLHEISMRDKAAVTW